MDGQRQIRTEGKAKVFTGLSAGVQIRIGPNRREIG